MDCKENEATLIGGSLRMGASREARNPVGYLINAFKRQVQAGSSESDEDADFSS